MIEKLTEIEKRYEDINAELIKPEIAQDIELYRKLMKEFSRLQPIVEKFREFKNAEAACNEAEEIIKSGTQDHELKELAQAELAESRENCERIREELKILLIPPNPDDDRSAIVEIRGGAGGEEAALFAGVLMRMYSMYAEAHRWNIEMIDENTT